MRTYLYVYICGYIYIRIYVHVYLCICIHIFTCMYVYVHIYMVYRNEEFSAYVHKCMNRNHEFRESNFLWEILSSKFPIFRFSVVFWYLYLYIYIYIDTYVHMHKYTNIKRYSYIYLNSCFLCKIWYRNFRVFQ